LAKHCMRKAPERRWKEARDEIRRAIERRGYDSKRGVFVQSFGRSDLDAALLRLPVLEFVAFDDDRMVRTADAIADELAFGGLIRRYTSDDSLEGEEGAFVACSFWLSECFARQGRLEEARAVFDRTISTANGLGLFSEQYDPERQQMLGNFPQALSHLSHLEAALALAETRPEGSGSD
jgi:GH15 family glucan-1,4-alpha-glucosidase